METLMENDLEAVVRLLTLRETAELLRVSRRTLQRMIDRKKLPVFRVGRQWRVRESELIEWIGPQ